MGHSCAGGAATIAAAQEADLVSAVVEISPFTRAQKLDLGALVSNARYRKGMSAPTDAGARLADITCPALVIEGTLDPDWPNPRAEGAGVVAGMPEGLGSLEMIEGAGHYAHVQFPAEVASTILAFLGVDARG